MYIDVEKTLAAIGRDLQKESDPGTAELKRAYAQTLRLQSQLLSLIYDAEDFRRSGRQESFAQEMQKMFSVAHDYIQLAMKEHITEAPQGNDLQQPLEKDGLRRFLDAYNSLQYRSAEKSDRESLSSLAKSLGYSEAGDNWKKLLNAWPQNGQTDVNKIKELFEALNFPVARVEARKGGRHFWVDMRASETNTLHFAHPILAYGTQLFPAPERGKNSGLDVYILNGEKTTAELVQAVSGLKLDSQPTVFLLDWSIPLGERREMTRELKQDSACPATAIVVDRVLMLFLARYPQAERTQLLL